MRSGESAAMGAQPVGPSRLWYWVAGAAGVAAVAWFALSFFLGLQSISRQVEGFQRVPIPGQAEVSFAEPGGYTLYYEGPGASDEQATIPRFTVSLAPVGGGQEVSIRDYGASITYDFAHSGRAVGSFRIEEPGRFLLRTEGELQGAAVNVAVGRGVGSGMVRTLIVPMAGGLILLTGGVVLAGVVAARRRRARPVPVAQPVAAWGQASAPAGWFADPGGGHELRYWDGQRWTEHVSDRGTQGVDLP
jgi:Protein of unknown function (DUF2510)